MSSTAEGEYYHDSNSEEEPESDSENEGSDTNNEGEGSDTDHQNEGSDNDHEGEGSDNDQESEGSDNDHKSEGSDNDHESEESDTEKSDSIDDEEDTGMSNDNDDISNNDIIDSKSASSLWTKSTNFVPKITPCGNGISIIELGDLDFSSTPLMILRYILQDEIIEDIRIQTNLYASQMRLANPKTLKNWNDVTTAELWSFFGLELLMGIDKKPSYKDYWSTNPLLCSPIFGKSMARDRFLSILQSLHFIDNESKGATDHRLNKLGNFLPSVMQRFQELVEPGEFLCVDETLLLFKGRLSFLQYIPSKRARFGIKFYVLVDCETKYVVSMLPYTGKTTKISQDLVKQLGFGGAVVTSLADKYLDEHRKIVVDNFFSSPILADHLKARNTYILGTVRANRKGMPKMSTTLKKGEVEVFHSSSTIVERWCDRRYVHIINNFMKHEMKAAPCKKYVAAKGTGKDIEERMKPATVLLYNTTMGGVDDVDRQIEPYTTERKTTKWYRKVAFHLLDLCVYNSFIIYKYIRGGAKAEYKTFLLELIANIMETYKVPRAKIGRPVRYFTPEDERSHGLHVPIPKFTSGGSPSRVRCHLCAKKGNRRLTQFVCKSCGVRLCIKPVKSKIKMSCSTTSHPHTCFERYHNLKTCPFKNN